MKSIREAARFYLDNNFRPIPVYGPQMGCKCQNPEGCSDQCLGKVPIDRDWMDKDLYSPWDFPDGCNLALAMGKQQNGKWLLGVDFDGDINVSDMLFLPPTLTVRSGRGYHMIYEVRPDCALGNWVDVLGTRDKKTGYKGDVNGAIDFRYCRGALLAPPSTHKSGKKYEWHNFTEPLMLPEDTLHRMRARYYRKHPNVKRHSSWRATHKDLKP